MKIIVLTGAALAALATAAVAQPGPGARGERAVDVTRAEAAQRAAERFARLDSNNDGRITAEEVRQQRQQRRAEGAARLFDRLDSNNDGSISRAEFDQARSQRAERRGERGPRGGMRGMHRGGGHRMLGEQGFVTREQFVEQALARFDRVDADRNGTVTVAERQQARQQMRQRMQERRGRAD